MLSFFIGVGGMLYCKPKSYYNLKYSISDGIKQVAEIDIKRNDICGSFQYDYLDYRIQKDGLVFQKYVLDCYGKVIMTANREHPLYLYDLEVSGERYYFKPYWYFSSNYVLRKDYKDIGRVRRKSIFSMEGVVDLPDMFSVPQQIFLFWLVNLCWRKPFAS